MRKSASRAINNYKEPLNTDNDFEFLLAQGETMPWEKLISLVHKHFAFSNLASSKTPIEVFIRIYFVKLWSGLSMTELFRTLSNDQSIRRFVTQTCHVPPILPSEKEILSFFLMIEDFNLENEFNNTLIRSQNS